MKIRIAFVSTARESRPQAPPNDIVEHAQLFFLLVDAENTDEKHI